MPDVLLERIPPQNLEAEQSTLGSMMIEPVACAKGLEILKANDFYRPAHQEVFCVLEALTTRDEPIDLITTQEELRKRGKLEDVGGTEYLMALCDSVPTAANVEYYARIVEKKSILRKLIAAGTEIIGLANCEDEEIDVVLSKAHQAAMGIERKYNTEATPISEIVSKVWKKIVDIDEGKKVIGVPFGIPALDAMSYGIEDEPQLTIIAARPSNGKTALLNQLAIQAAKNNKRVLYFSLETSKEQLAHRMIYLLSGVDAGQFRMHRWKSEEEHQSAMNQMADAMNITLEFQDNILMRDLRPQSVYELISQATRDMQKHNIDMIFIDYIQLLSAGHRCESRNVEVQEVFQKIKGLCSSKNYRNIPVVVAAQLSRASEKREDKKPQLSDLREGGNMEGEADKVILIHNPPPTDKTKIGEVRDKSELILAKHKDGPTGSVGCYFHPGCMRFGEYLSDLYE
jgi:replicative DNA helicase